ncbi:MAG: trypsin-like peptidase domain-containing protein [Gemmatimonadota bacterium]|nr:trypsin-like peptidase domain-containing protein [Gemmatimonadota bacterium]
MRRLAVVGVLALIACGEASRQAVPVAAQTPPPPPAMASQDLAVSRRTAIVTASERVAPAVVSVNVVRRERQVDGGMWSLFFAPREFERTVQGLGSGFVVSPDGLVITNQHVVAGAEQIVVTTRDGSDYPATLLGEDPLTDIAVLRIEGTDLPTVPLGTSRTLVIGEWVIAIGNPFGYLFGNAEPTVTAGVVSGVGRNLLPSGEQSGVYVDMIQTDAAINPGNSGGPLVNALGEVVGVNSSILSRSGGSEGIGFAIPIDRAMRVAGELSAHGAVRRAWVGVDVAGADAMRSWKQRGGLAVLGVTEQSPAWRAGIRAGDVLVEADGRPLRTFLDWEAVKLDIGPGDTVPLRVARDGRPRAVRVQVEDLPTATAEKVDILGGLRLVTLTPAIRQERGVRSEAGALIYEIPEATARQTGLRTGDVIRQINQGAVASAEDVERLIGGARGRGAMRIFFEREGRVGFSDFYVR